MRKSVFFILLATAAMPALAAAQDRDDRGFRERAARSEQSESKGDKSSHRSERAPRSERADSDQAAVQRVERTERSARSQQVIVQSPDGSPSQYSGRGSRMTSRPADSGQPATATSSNNSDGVTNWRSRERRASRYQGTPTATDSTNWRDRTRDGQTSTNWRDRTRDGQASTNTTQSTTTRRWDGNRDGSRHWDGNRDGRHRWSGDWRRDDRYDWRRHRSRYSSLFRLGRYYDPYRYGYRRFSIGLFLGSGYYQNSNYWLNDPWQYRLPPAYGTYRWIRYYNDALLVDIYSGEVVDVIYGFFW